MENVTNLNHSGKITCTFTNNFYDEEHEFEIDNSPSFEWKGLTLEVIDFMLFLDAPEIESNDIEDYVFRANAILKDTSGRTIDIILEDKVGEHHLCWRHEEDQESGCEDVIHLDMHEDEDGDIETNPSGPELYEVIYGLKLDKLFDEAYKKAKELGLVWKGDEEGDE